MFERFTDRSRQVLVLAQEEAQRLDHAFIGTEHILLALIGTDDSVAAQVLTDLGVETAAVREQVEETIRPLGGPSTGSPPFTPRAKMVLELALREAQQLGDGYISTEHILLGLIREGRGVGAQALTSLGVDLASVRQRITQRLVELRGDQPSTDAMEPGRGRSAGERSRAQVVTCSFCGLSPPESGRLVSGDDAFICERCVRRWSLRLGSGATIDRSWVSEASSDVPSAGPEPDDADAARAEIKTAFLTSRIPSEDGRSVPSVERGDDLGPTLTLANDRHRGIIADGSDVTISADEIRFYRVDRAAVRFSVWMGDQRLLWDQRGEAVLVDHKWKMARSTFSLLMRLAGVACPPETE